MKYIISALCLIALCLAAPVSAKVDLVALPARDKVQLTIYNSADLTLVRDTRTLTLAKGVNRLQFSWIGTLIDPTSLEISPREHGDKVTVNELGFPPRTANLGLFQVNSEITGSVPVEITYLTSGLSWRAFYMGSLSPDEKTMHLEGYVRVSNESGEDYKNAQTRLIVGQVNVLDEIAELAHRRYPFGRPGIMITGKNGDIPTEAGEDEEFDDLGKMEGGRGLYAMAEQTIKEIRKEGLSEYFLYTIEGTETIPDGWSKRLPSFEAADIPVVNLYKYEEEKFGPRVVRFLSFINDKDHKLGDTPIPGGEIRVYRLLDNEGRLAYQGESEFQYIPVDEDVELNIGSVQDVVVQPVLMSEATDRYRFDEEGNIKEWDEIREFRITVKNTRPLPVRVQIRRNAYSDKWELEHSDLPSNTYEKIDLETFQFTLDLAPGASRDFTYTITTHQQI